jgi:hypothetical protein
MKKYSIAFLILIGWALAVGGTAVGQSFKEGAAASAEKTVPVTIVVSVEARHGTEVPEIYKEDVRVFQEEDRVKVTDWRPLRADHAGLELFILVDDACDTSAGSQLDDLRRFVNSQGDATLVGVGYIRNSSVQIAQNLTRDHAQAAHALRIPLGFPAAYSSPYLAVTSLVEGWPANGNRRAIFLVSPGMDGLQSGATNSYLEEAIDHARRAKIEVYTIYASPSGRFGRNLWRVGFGQSNLSKLADETGGDAYFQGFQTPLSFAPFLEQFGDRLKHQYSLTFLANAGDEPKDYRIRLETEVTNAELVGPNRVRVPAAK